MDWYGASSRILGSFYSKPALDYAFKKWKPIFSGQRTYENTIASNDLQRRYENYLIYGNWRAYRDWHRNVGGPQGKRIRYPELSYPGQIYRASTSIGRLGYADDSAYSNYYGNVPFRSMGLYAVGSTVSRWL